MRCFLCFYNLSSFDSDDGTENKVKITDWEKVSLTAINNYLNLRDKCQSYSSFNDDGKEDKVILCPECEIVTSNLSLLCNQLEEIKLKINYSLEQFMGKLETAKEDEVDNGLDEELLMLRNNYIQTCKSKLSKLRQPVIKLDKLKMVKVEMKTELVSSDEETGYDYDDFEINESSASVQDPQELQENILEVKVTPIEDDEWNDSSSAMSSSAPPSKPSHHRPPTKKEQRMRATDVNGNFVCRTCGLKFPSLWERRQHTHVHRNARNHKEAKFICTLCTNHQMFKEAHGLRRHNMIFHVELLFPDSRIDRMSSTQFGEYCKHVLHVEGLLSKLPNSSGYVCQHCKNLGLGKQVHLTTYLVLKKHLFRKHKDILDEKLEELQRTTGPEELKQIVLPPIRDNRKCDDCGASFSQADSLSRHLRESCPYRKNKDVSAAKPCKCQECGKKYNYTAAFYRHRKNKHPNSTKDPMFI